MFRCLFGVLFGLVMSQSILLIMSYLLFKRLCVNMYVLQNVCVNMYVLQNVRRSEGSFERPPAFTIRLAEAGAFLFPLLMIAGLTTPGGSPSSPVLSQRYGITGVGLLHLGFS